MSDTWSCLIRIKATDGLRSHLIAKPVFSIGRSQDADLPLLSSGISRLHLYVEVKNNSIYISDQRSSNGTFVNGNRIEPMVQVRLNENDIIRLGTHGEDLYFIATPLPFEMLNREAKKDALVDSMEELAKQVEAKYKEKYDSEIRNARTELKRLGDEAKKDADELRSQAQQELQVAQQALETQSHRARVEADQILAQAQKETESLKAQALAEAQTRRLELETENRRTRSEIEQLMAQAQKEAEILKTQTLVDAQNRKQELEAEIARLKQDAFSLQTQERLNAKKEADRIIADAQKTIQKDFESSNQKIQEQLEGTRAKSVQILEEAEGKARSILSEAQDDAVRIRREASDEARVINQEAQRKNTESYNQMLERFQKESQIKEQEILDRARLEADKIKQIAQKDAAQELEKAKANADQVRQSASSDAQLELDRVLKENGAQISLLKKQIAELEQKAEEQTSILNSAKSDLTQLTAQRNERDFELKSLAKELADARVLLNQVNELENRRSQAESQLRDFTRQRDEGMAKIEREFKEMREKSLLEFENSKKEQANELARLKLKGTEDINKQLQAAEQQYEKTLELRAVELSQKLQERFIPQLEKWSKDPGAAAISLKQEIEDAVGGALLKETSAFKAAVGLNPAVNSEELALKKKKQKQMIAAAVAVAVVVIGIYWQELFSLMKKSQESSYASTVLERRRELAAYKPEQTAEYRDTYTENVLYLRHYYEVKMNTSYQKSWTLRLNDLELLRTLGIGEEDIIEFIAKETTLIRRLGDLRNSIDAVYLNEGLERMRTAENEEVLVLKEIVKGEANFQKIRSLEDQFIKDFLSRNNIKGSH